jgi:hypothetical protein
MTHNDNSTDVYSDNASVRNAEAGDSEQSNCPLNQNNHELKNRYTKFLCLGPFRKINRLKKYEFMFMNFKLRH